MPARAPIRNLRFWILALLFASTLVNYVDRQVLSLLKPTLSKEFDWNEKTYAAIVMAFQVAYAIAHSPLVKTAFFASDPNLGRILAAVGYAGVELDVSRVDLFIDQVPVAKAGARNPAYREEQAVAAMKKPEFTVRAVLNRGKADATVWTCDLSFDYVKINAEYRT